MQASVAARGTLAVVGPEATVADAARVMLSGDARAVVVAQEGRVVGIVTERDIIARVVSQDLPLSTPVRTVMTPEPVTLPAAASVSQAYATLREHGLRRLPLVDGVNVVGLLELDDLVSELTGDAFSDYRQCPHCGGEQLRVVTDGESSKLLCLECRNCWHIEQGGLVRVDPETCPGCPDRFFCRFPSVP
jgi:CBS-domain-containing membrane protein